MEELLKKLASKGYQRNVKIEEEHLLLADIQKWFRDVKNVHIQPMLIAQLDPKFGWGYEISAYNINTNENESFETYEECLKFCISEALELI